MMKKFAALMIALVLALAAFSACAETAVTELNWESGESLVTEMGLEGDFVTFEQIALQMWIPASMTQSELTQENVDQGFIAHFLDDDQTTQISVVYVDVNGMSLDEYAAVLPEYGATDVEAVIVNGLPAVGYTMTETDSATLAFATEAGYVLEITMAPISVENAEIGWGIIVSSIMAA